MKDTEQLEFEYFRLEQERDLHLFDEKCAHKKVLECEKKMQLLERDIKGFKEDNFKDKLNNCIDFIKHYCKGINCCCEECKFYREIDEFNKTNCLLRNNFPEYWETSNER